jgi:tellurite resistance protein
MVFSEQARTLEDAFFLKEDQKLVENLRNLKKMQETQAALAQVSGIQDEQVLKRLVELDIHPEVVAALAVVPLVEVAWADGDVDAQERAAILKIVEQSGVAPGGIEYQLIDEWLTHRPEPRLLEAWKHYVEGLCGSLNPEERGAFKQAFLANTRQVAEASGGFFGLSSKVSKSEAQVLAQLENAFG